MSTWLLKECGILLHICNVLLFPGWCFYFKGCSYNHCRYDQQVNVEYLFKNIIPPTGIYNCNGQLHNLTVPLDFKAVKVKRYAKHIRIFPGPG